MADQPPDSGREGLHAGTPSKSPRAGALAPGLYLVATPVGNLGDMTFRAVDVLKGVDLIACEDTRVSGRLTAHYGIDTPMRPYHDHNGPKVRPDLLRQLEAGARIALISDAGTPLISDPGYKLVREARERGIMVTAVPGASALLPALSLSALPTDRFAFLGFAPPKRAARRKFLQSVAGVEATLALYESPRRLGAMLADAAQVLGARPAAVARELTKRFEEVRTGDLVGLAETYASEGPPKGEIVVIIGPPDNTDPAADLDALLGKALARASIKDAVREVTDVTGLPRRVVYQRALDLADVS